MKINKLRINQLSSQAFQKYLSYLQAMDQKDLDAYVSFLSEDCALQMNNEEPVQGKVAIAGKLGPYWKTFDKIEHDLLNIYGTDQAYVLEALNHYVRVDQRQVSLRAVAFTDLNDSGKVTSVRLYTDVSSVFV